MGVWVLRYQARDSGVLFTAGALCFLVLALVFFHEGMRGVL